MRIEFNDEEWDLERMPGQPEYGLEGYWVLNKIPYIDKPDTSISFYGNDSIEELKERLKKIEKNT